LNFRRGDPEIHAHSLAFLYLARANFFYKGKTNTAFPGAFPKKYFSLSARLHLSISAFAEAREAKGEIILPLIWPTRARISAEDYFTYRSAQKAAGRKYKQKEASLARTEGGDILN